MFLLRVSRTKRSSENSNEKSGSVLVYILTKLQHGANLKVGGSANDCIMRQIQK